METLLRVSGLQTVFRTETGEWAAVDDVSFSLVKGETLAIVGESGCGKSVTSLSIMRLLGKSGRIKQGNITFNGEELTLASEDRMQQVRGNQISMVFQEPMSSLNPVFSIGNQLLEPIRLHLKLPRKEARDYAVQLLQKVGISRAESVMDEYPHMLSGGMRQRVMIAMALACRPQLLIADEPTTALDVTIQAQILDLMKKLREESRTYILLITHDLGIVAELADRVLVMYAGQVVEEADVFRLFEKPFHPYTQGLIQSIPHLNHPLEQRLHAIPGTVPELANMPEGCRFHDRCASATELCRERVPPLAEVEVGHKVRCWLAHEQSFHGEKEDNEEEKDGQTGAWVT
jgi:peptide/nickel transport system ATP-binding protein